MTNKTKVRSPRNIDSKDAQPTSLTSRHESLESIAKNNEILVSSCPNVPELTKKKKKKNNSKEHADNNHGDGTSNRDKLIRKKRRKSNPKEPSHPHSDKLPTRRASTGEKKLKRNSYEIIYPKKVEPLPDLCTVKKKARKNSKTVKPASPKKKGNTKKNKTKKGGKHVKNDNGINDFNGVDLTTLSLVEPDKEKQNENQENNDEDSDGSSETELDGKRLGLCVEVMCF